jgi:hypothetical protein
MIPGWLITAFYSLPQIFAAAPAVTGPTSDAACPGGGFFGLPPWYKYLKSTTTNSNLLTGANKEVCTPYIGSITDFLLIGLAVLEMLLRVAAFMAILFVLYGGFKYITSQAEPEKLKAARGTIINAIIGLVIAVSSTALITFIAGRFA